MSRKYEIKHCKDRWIPDRGLVPYWTPNVIGFQTLIIEDDPTGAIDLDKDELAIREKALDMGANLAVAFELAREAICGNHKHIVLESNGTKESWSITW